ncbi:MAG: FRG domain-containing protein [Vallitaleaceae bacterium]|nr:FRG domain-containing protein [Vallitaleaceae bacterium]
MSETIISSFKEYVEYTEKYKNRYLFRGQANIEWSIMPSLFRNDKALKDEVIDIQGSLDGPQSNVLTTLFKLQHYGKPTRLLDLTISPLSALFFSIDDESQLENDGVIYIIDRKHQYSVKDKEVLLFGEYLLKSEEDIENQGIGNLVCKDYLIKYDYDISYTNKRAILQGGTALIFGFDKIGKNYARKSSRSINGIIHERIIIPKEAKNHMQKELKRIGYDKDILYGSSDFESHDELKFQEEEFKLTRTAEFNKIIAKYRIDRLKFDRDQLLNIITNLYKTLFSKYGDNARIWLYFAYDENDESIGNWICRTQWNADVKYKIIWSTDYYTRRLSNMNEQISQNELIYEFQGKIKSARRIHNEINSIVSLDQYELKKLLSYMTGSKTEIKKVFIQMSDIGLGDVDIEMYAQSAENYVCDVDSLVSEILYYAERGENEKFLRYWAETKLKDCNKSYDELLNEFSRVNLG